MSSSSLRPKICLFRYPSLLPAQLRGGVVTIGNFDGVHRGHQAVLSAVRSIAGDRPVGVVSLYPHPLRVLKGLKDLRPITGVREKMEQLSSNGVSYLHLLHFTRRTASMTASQFVDEVFLKCLGIQGLVVGEDAVIGRNREGDVEFLRTYLPRYGITLDVVPQLVLSGIRPSSRLIRERIQLGDLDGASALLGRTVSISGRVSHGDGRGRQIGYPTANITAADHLLPKPGVYACQCRVESGHLSGQGFDGVVNIGTRPTFAGVGVRTEVHLFDMHASTSLYGDRLEVRFIRRLRDEQKFSSVDELRAQIDIDSANARTILAAVQY